MVSRGGRSHGEIMTKICGKCGIERSLEGDFYADKSKKSGRHSHCKECQKKASGIWHLANPERATELRLRWRREYKEREKATKAQWKRNNPELNRASVSRRKAIKLAFDGTHYTAADVKALFEQQQGHCLYCYNRLDTFHVDHVIPLSRGGGNGSDNIALACPSCNLSKNNKLLGLEWIPPYRADSSCFSGLNPVE